MNPAHRAPDLRLYLPLAALAFMTIFAFVSRLRVRRVFGAAAETDPAALESVRERLAVINAQCRTHVFGAERVVDVAVAGRGVSLIYGMIGFLEPLHGGTSKRAYALAEGDEVEWMRRFPDVFELAVSTSRFAVFWVRLPTLMRLTRRGSAPPACLCYTL